MNKKYIVGGVIVASVLAGVSSLAFAQDSIVSPGMGAMPTVKVQDTAKEMVLQVGPRGEALLRGTITAVGTNSLTVSGWGGAWTVNVPTTAQVLPQNTTLSQFAVGEFVGVQGTINTGSSWTIDAKLVRDWTTKKENLENRMIQKTQEHTDSKNGASTNTSDKGMGVQQQIQSILEQIKKIQAQMGTQGQ